MAVAAGQQLAEVPKPITSGGRTDAQGALPGKPDQIAIFVGLA